MLLAFSASIWYLSSRFAPAEYNVADDDLIVRKMVWGYDGGGTRERKAFCDDDHIENVFPVDSVWSALKVCNRRLEASGFFDEAEGQQETAEFVDDLRTRLSLADVGNC